MAGDPPPKKSGLSLYADLLKPSDDAAPGATISSAPVKYDLKKVEEDPLAVQKKKDASLMFQPIKRPQQQNKKPGNNNKNVSSSSAHRLSSSSAIAPTTSSPDKSALGLASQQRPAFQRSTIEDWIGDDDDDFGYQDRQRQQRQQRKWSKRKKKQGRETQAWDWDDIYDPTQPNHYADYKKSEESVREVRDWKARLYYHHLKADQKNKRPRATSSDDEDSRSRSHRPANPMFAPPSMNFAPPKLDDTATPQSMDTDDDYYPPSLPNDSLDDLPDRPSFAQNSQSDDASGDDAYMRRARLSGMATASNTVPASAPIMAAPEHIPPPPAPASAPEQSSPTPPVSTPIAPIAAPADEDKAAKIAAAQAKIAAFKAKLGKPPSNPPATPAAVAPPPTVTPEVAQPPQILPPPPPPPPPSIEQKGSIISREPVRYVQPQSSASPDASHEDPEMGTLPATSTQPNEPPKSDTARSNRPGQKGFGERLLMKYGWEKGQGLGAQGEGITTAIFAKADKRKKRPDAQGGGFATPANMGRIVGGKRRKIEGAEGGSGEGDDVSTSQVVKIEGMLAGLDVAREIEDNNLMQVIGDQMGTSYGNVERLFIWREAAGGADQVFVKFNSALSALRAVNAPDGIAFAGNSVKARFFDEDKFESGEYE